MSRKAMLLLCAMLVAHAGSVSAQQSGTAADREAVRQAVLDYVEGFYLGDTTRLVRGVVPTVYKYGYFKQGQAYVGEQMKWPEFMSYANGIKSGRNKTPANAPKEITIFDVADQTASAKLTAWWGIDYLLVAKQPNGRWMITHVMWQTPPPK
jgi:hypothetical protein